MLLATTSSRPKTTRAPALPAAALVALVLALGAAGCGGPSGSSAATAAASEVTARPTPATARPGGTLIRVHITGDSVTPAGTRVPVSAGKPVTLLITASAAGELHVHSTPERHVSYPKGTSAATLTFDQPGIVEIESHQLEKTIVQLEVR